MHESLPSEPGHAEGFLFRLSPRSQILVGLLVTGLGVSLLAWALDHGVFTGIALFATLFGLLTCAAGVRGHWRRRRFQRERERARAELAELIAAGRAEQQAGGSVVRMLQARGYRDRTLRSWLRDRIADAPEDGG